jgi:lysophospholipase L1-like esterase
MAQYTNHFNLYKPSRNDNESVDQTLSTNFETIDQEINNRKVEMDSHKTAGNAHAAENISYGDSNVKEALDSIVQITNDALAQSETADTTSSEALTTANDVKDQFNKVVAEAGSSNPEVVLARGTYAQLKDRFAANETSLAEKAKQTDLNTTNANVSANATALATKADKSYVDTKVAAVASGSPKGVYPTLSALQTAFPTGNANIYVVTADGKWYYWNGSAWSAGGIYQSTGVPDKSITYNKTDFMVSSTNLFNKNTVTDNFYIDINGNMLSSSTLCVSDYIPVQPGDVLSVSAGFGSPGGTYDSNKNYIGLPYTTSISTTSFTVPANVYYLRLNMFISYANTWQDKTGFMLVKGSTLPASYVPFKLESPILLIKNDNIESVDVNKIGSIPMTKLTGFIRPDQLSDNIQRLSTNLLNPNTVTYGYFVSSTTGLPVTSQSYIYYTDYIPVTGNAPYSFTSLISQPGAWYDANKNFISALPSAKTNFTTTSPSNAVYLRWNGDNYNTPTNSMIVAGSVLPSSFVPYSSSFYELPWLKLNSTQAAQSKSKWANKSWLVIGDSITGHNFRTNKNYHDYIKDLINCTVYNNGQGGTGYYNRYNESDSITVTPDLITVFLGTNDWGNVSSNNLPLGVLGDTGTTTVAGCINALLSSLSAKFYNKSIAVFTPIPRSDNWGSMASKNAQGYTLEQLAEMIKTIGKHYSIPVLDLYHNSNLPVWDTNGNKYYFTAPGYTDPDGLHPNDAGHQVLADKILSFINTL